MKSLTRRASLLAEADRKQRQIRAVAFLVAAGVSTGASITKTNAWGWAAAVTWMLFIGAIVVHRVIRARAQRLAWRRTLEDRLQDLRDLKVNETLSWDLPAREELENPAMRRLIRDLDIVPSAASPRAFAALFPFFLSTAGQLRFLNLLTSPVSDIAELRRRQKIALFWEKRVVLRRKIQRLSSTLEGALNTDSLSKIAVQAVAPEKPWVWFGLVAVAQVAFFGCWIAAAIASNSSAGAPSYKWIATLGLAGLFVAYAVVLRRINLLASYPQAMLLGRSLRVLHHVAAILTRVSHLPDADLQAFSGEKNPVRVLQDIERASGALGVRQNPLLALLINFVIPWDLYWTIRFDLARRKVAGSIADWLTGLADLEAFIALAEWNVAHGLALPEFVEGESANLVDAKKLAHPLLPVDRRIANDLLITRVGRNHLITGSNMSGKSTFLRAVGLNILLAHAGAKVTAASLRLVPLRLESSMRPADSLADGFSSFYSEVSDLVEIVKLAETQTAVFYLIDEIFRGTNNRERRIGAEAVIRALAKTSALGFVTTHDLDLAALEGVVPGVENHHFRDDVTDGRMTFSYEYRRGPCPSTNALKVMRGAGLPVP